MRGERDIDGVRARISGLRTHGLTWWAIPVTWFWLMLMSFLQRLGQITFDTKFDLTADPGSFLGRSLSLWNPDSSFGELQNQAYGYLFPQGSFFLLFDRLGLSDWLAQRFWSGLLLVVAFEGCRRLFAAMSGGTALDQAGRAGRSDRSEPTWAPWVAGIAYATAPRLLGLSGVLSGEVLQTAVLPWVVLPIVLAQRGRMGLRTAAAASGVAMLFLGGVNAVGNLAVLPLVAFVVLSGVRRAGGLLLARWWVGAVVLASAWWMLPLLVLGRYSPPFLDYIETSSAVVQPLGWTNVIRGADHWLAFFDVGGIPWWPGAHLLATEPLLIGVTAGIAALGLLGLTRTTMPLRKALVGSVLLGALCLTVSRGGALASPLHDQFQYLLDGPLSMLRNVHKVDPLLRLPLALGLANLVHSWSRTSRSTPVSTPRSSTARVRSEGAARSGSAVLAQAMVVVVLLVSAQPLWTGELRKPGWDHVPDAWSQTADYLARAGGTGSALVLPGAGFGQQSWGWTIDEPLQGLARTPWVSRSQVPLTPGTTIRFLDAIQRRVADGQGSPDLADVLARAGIEYVVVRRDLDLFASGAPEPARVDLALNRSPGFTRMAGFGSSGLGDQSMIDILHVDRPIQRVETVATSDVETLAGSSEDVLSAMEAGVLDPQVPVVVRGEPGWDQQTPDIVGDGYRRTERGFGALDAVGPVLSRDEPYRHVRAAHDYAGPESTPRVYAAYGEVSSVRASTSGGYSDSFGEVQPDLAPYAAIDARRGTYWQSASLSEPVGQWLEVRFGEPQVLTDVVIRAGVDGSDGVPVRRVRVQSGDVNQTVPVDPETGLAAVSLPGRGDRVRITVAGVEGDVAGQGGRATGVVSLHDVSFPGLDVDRHYVVPDEGAQARTAFVLRARPDRRGCVDAGLGTSCNFLRGPLESDEETGISRQITVDQAGTWSVQGTAVARSSSASQRLLEPVLEDVRVRASSTLHNEPGVAPQLAYDADPSTFWAASAGDRNPTLRLRSSTPRTVSSIQVTAPSTSAVAPVSAVLVHRRQRRTVDLTTGRATFPPLTGRRVQIHFRGPSGSDSPVGVAELSIDGLDSQRHRIDRQATSGAICGLGPEVVVDGVTHPTRVTGTVGEVIDGTPLRVEPCDAAIDLAAGPHQVRFTATQQFSPTELVLQPPGVRAAPTPTRRDTQVDTWTADRRTVAVGPGPDAVMTVAENFNDGWSARLDGADLTPIRVDGWKQGFLVPEGRGGEVALTFGPNRWYRGALVLGALAAAALLGLALVGRRRERMRLVPEEDASEPDAKQAQVPWRRRWRLVGVVAAGVLGGPALLLGAALGSFGRRWVRDPGALGALLVVLAGVTAGIVAAVDPGLPPLICDVAAATGLGLVAATLAWAPGRAPADREEASDV